MVLQKLKVDRKNPPSKHAPLPKEIHRSFNTLMYETKTGKRQIISKEERMMLEKAYHYYPYAMELLHTEIKLQTFQEISPMDCSGLKKEIEDLRKEVYESDMG